MSKIFLSNFQFFQPKKKNLCILHKQVFVMKFLSSFLENIHKSFVFFAIPGRYACQLVPRSPLPSQDISVLETKLRLFVSVLPQTNQPEVKSFALSLPFLPPFYTHNAEIHVSTLTPLSSLRISSVAALAGEIQVILQKFWEKPFRYRIYEPSVKICLLVIPPAFMPTGI